MCKQADVGDTSLRRKVGALAAAQRGDHGPHLAERAGGFGLDDFERRRRRAGIVIGQRSARLGLDDDG